MAVDQSPAVEGSTRPLNVQLHDQLNDRMADLGLSSLYTHQADAVEHALAGRDVIVVTGTSSGKSLCYGLPIAETCLREPAARALVLYPTKALAQDQAGKFQKLLPEGIVCGTYDGDTSTASRSAARKHAHVLLSNPDMLHRGILPWQENWGKFFRALRFIVIDEAHVYRGVFGSHVGNVVRRLLRLCEWYQNRPQIIACSATIANPVELFTGLTGRPPVVVDHDTAPRGRRIVALVAAPEDGAYSPNRDTAELLAEFAVHNVHTLAFCRSRVGTELVVRQARATLAKRGASETLVDAYRGGYTAKERREIEKSLSSGRLHGLATTNAMELGVDVGGLDAVVMNGFPGSVSSFWQQAGRAGRGRRDGLAVMLARQEPLEQFLVRQPELLLGRPVESALLNPDNPHILRDQLRCAAYERPIAEEELGDFGKSARTVADQLVEEGSAIWQGGRLYLPTHTSPAKDVDIRGSGGQTVVLMCDGQPLGEMERWRAMRQAHEGAIYLHRGKTYSVTALDLDRHVATLTASEPDYFTQAVVQSVVETTLEIEERAGIKLVGVRVTTSVPKFLRKSLDGDSLLGEEPLELPVETMETLGVRLDLPDVAFDQAGVVHALEHALTQVAPLIAGCDPNDLGSCWYAMTPETLAPGVYVYDACPGGTGLCERLFQESAKWWSLATTMVQGCPCTEGCPSCLLSPRCESGNDTLDKSGALDVLLRQIGP